MSSHRIQNNRDVCGSRYLPKIKILDSLNNELASHDSDVSLRSTETLSDTANEARLKGPAHTKFDL